MSDINQHTCAVCGHTWESLDSETYKKICAAAKVNGQGPSCGLCMNLEMAYRYAEAQGYKSFTDAVAKWFFNRRRLNIKQQLKSMPVSNIPSLLGAKVVNVRKLTETDADDAVIEINAPNETIVIELDNGVCLVPLADDDSNAPGALIGLYQKQTFSLEPESKVVTNPEARSISKKLVKKK